MNFSHREEHDSPEINLIPLIDVLLVILIFLAATTSFSRQTRLEVILPQAQAEALDPTPVIELDISPDGLYALDNHALDIRSDEDLAHHLQRALAERPDATLRVAADGQARHAAVVRALEAARLAHIERIQFLTQTQP
ncbi:ExbD/TolR family protein [Castellaniella sp.]|uniref:ExbD/TolR family protein n=1 Tax=Castellaniella sp. TaxID=1955812 RepID=UPI0035644770